KPSRAPAWLRAVLERGLATDASARFESMQDLVGALAEPQRGWAILTIVALGVAALTVAGLGLQRWYETQAPRLLPGKLDPGEFDSDNFALLPGGRGSVYTKDQALWHRELDADDAPRRLDEAYWLWLTRDVGRDGRVFFTIHQPDFDQELYRLRDVDGTATRISGFPGGGFCPLVDHGLAVTFWAGDKLITLHALGDDDMTKLRDIDLDGEFTWIHDIA